MANEFIARNGIFALNDSQVTGSLSVSNGITGSLFGTSSYATVAANGGVTQLLAGPNITLAPTNGLGQVTISSTSGGGGGFNTATGSYGSFYDTTTQTNPVGNIPRSMSLDTTDITNGVSVSGSTNPFNTYIKTENAGVYNIQFSAQLDKTDAGKDEIVIWLRKNGIDLTDTATTVTLTNNNDKVVAAWNWFVNSAANDYYQIIWLSADTNIRLLAEPISGTHPGIPSLIVTANRVDQFLSNTGSFSGSFTGQFTGSLFGTSSYATQALSASYAPTASFATTASSVAGYYKYIFTSQSVGSNASGETQLISVTIPANSFATSDKFYFRLGFSKVGTTNSATIRVKLTTSSSMPSGATSQIGIASIGATALYGPMERNMAINGGNLKGFGFTSANVSDSAGSTIAWSSVALDVTQTQYFYVSITPAATTTDVTYLEFIEITNI